ncbi:hypothetical protein DC498_23695 [Terrimonas sp.]|nr:hypothetical protein DC498_23695 [Terrimonas sp.]
MLFVNNVCKVVVNNLKYNGKTLIFIDFERNKFFNDYGKGYQVSAIRFQPLQLLSVSPKPDS